MRSFLTGTDIFVEVQMQRQLDRRLVILTEGVEDCALLDAHLNDEVARSAPAYGKESALEAARLFSSNGVDYVIVLIDSDYDRITGLADAYPENIVSSEHADLVTDIFFACPPTFRQVLSSFTNREVRERNLSKQGLNASTYVATIAEAIGAVRFVSIREGLGLRMKAFPVEPLLGTFERGGIASRVNNCDRGSTDVE